MIYFYYFNFLIFFGLNSKSLRYLWNVYLKASTRCNLLRDSIKMELVKLKYQANSIETSKFQKQFFQIQQKKNLSDTNVQQYQFFLERLAKQVQPLVPKIISIICFYVAYIAFEDTFAVSQVTHQLQDSLLSFYLKSKIKIRQ